MGGDHTASLQSPQANVWGCQDQWGDLDVVVLPASLCEDTEITIPPPPPQCVIAYQTPDTRSGCPPAAAANSPLLSRTFLTSAETVVVATGHLIRNAAGRQDLHLYVDDV